MEDICNYLLGHEEVLDRIEKGGPGGKAVFVMFDDETEAAAAAAGLEIAHPSAGAAPPAGLEDRHHAARQRGGRAERAEHARARRRPTRS